MQNPPPKLLFICSQNRLRSLTAEHLYHGFGDYAVQSAGTAPDARIPVTAAHIRWADLIFVMEPQHARLLQARFAPELLGKRLICLHIPDIYRFMETALVDELKARLKQHISVPE